MQHGEYWSVHGEKRERFAKILAQICATLLNYVREWEYVFYKVQNALFCYCCFTLLCVLATESATNIHFPLLCGMATDTHIVRLSNFISVAAATVAWQ